MTNFANLHDAGEHLAALLNDCFHRVPAVVLAVVPNGVPVALPVGRLLGVRVLPLLVDRTVEGPLITEVPEVVGCHVIVIDDGVETGAVARAAAGALAASGAASVTLAVPVCSWEAMADLNLRFDEVIAVDRPLARRSLAWHYRHFDVISEAAALAMIADQKGN